MLRFRGVSSGEISQRARIRVRFVRGPAALLGTVPSFRRQHFVFSFRKILAPAVFGAALGFWLYQTVIVVQLGAAIRAGEKKLERLTDTERQAQLTVSKANRELAHAMPVGGPTLAPGLGGDGALTREITAWLARTAGLRRALAEHPEKNLPEIKMLTDEEWLSAAREIWWSSTEIDATGSRTEIDFLPNLDILRKSARRSFVGTLLDAIKSYQRKTGGELPGSFEELAPLLPSTFGPDIADRYDFAHENGIVTVVEKSRDPAQPDLLTYFQFSAHPLQRPYINFENKIEREVREAARRYTIENHGASPTKPEQLIPLLRRRLDPAELEGAFNALPP